MKLIEEFKDLVPDSLSFNVGYFEGQSYSKIWLVDEEDFSTMYKKYPRGEISLWCDGHTEMQGEEGKEKEMMDHRNDRKGRKKLMKFSSSSRKNMETSMTLQDYACGLELFVVKCMMIWIVPLIFQHLEMKLDLRKLNVSLSVMP